MKTVRGPQILSGFWYEDPLSDWPALTHCGDVVCDARLRLSTHTHRGFELLYLARGECTWEIDRRTPHQGMGDLFVAFPEQPHALAPVPHSELSVLWVGVVLDELNREARHLGARLRAARQHVIPRCHDVEPLLRGIVTQVTSARSNRQRAIEAFLNVIFQLLHQRLDAEAVEPDTIIPYSYNVQKAIGFLRTNLDRRIELAEIAKVAGCGLSQLCQRFKREVGCSPAAYHLRLRLTMAREMLGSKDATITNAAYQYGFSSSQHFRVAFRQFFGVTPHTWQRELVARSPATRRR